MTAKETLEEVLQELRACRICRDAPRYLPPLPHQPRPVIQASVTARLCIAGQAPGTRVHASGRPFTDPSGVRLRRWLGIDETVFYDPTKVAVVPMGFCFPGQDSKGGDLPPRRECAPTWQGLWPAAPRSRRPERRGAGGMARPAPNPSRPLRSNASTTQWHERCTLRAASALG